MHLPECVPQTLILLSKLHDTTYSPFGENFAEKTIKVCPFSVYMHLPSSTLHNLIDLSLLQEIIKFPLFEKPTY